MNGGRKIALFILSPFLGAARQIDSKEAKNDEEIFTDLKLSTGRVIEPFLQDERGN